MIRIEELSKNFSTVKAVDQVTFEVKKGEILGLLGPNGAGKTTTLRLISGYLRPDQGRIFVGDQDAVENTEAVRAMIGYLPEYNPIYQDMLVYDYLQYIAAMRALAPEVKEERVREMVTTCGLKDEVGKRISELSKGNRQRVGLAQAMLHDPEYLILDEPTAGLDPNQISDIRDLIKRLGRKKTVILSSHILSEVEATCDRVIIIHQGKVVADGNPKDLQRQAVDESRIHLKIAGDGNVNEVLKKLEHVYKVEADENESKEIRGYLVHSAHDHDLRPDIFRLAQKEGWVLYEMHREVVSLESIFRRLTSG
ncbi:ATP-binding cassette domain-containing protein [candidate division FCPU426 bacterium]|nr:ATP-binding cassette domain-containing protein [candidate division FCPU426 bacterium]